MARDLNRFQHVVMICQGKDCKKEGSKELAKAVKDCARELGLHRHTMIVKTKCTGSCKSAPVMCVQPSNQWVVKATPQSAADALRAAIKPMRLVG
ncbi:MAG: (2Fe-2S) ferredoxin domain-containing protein [bacterium]